jgi:protein arginine kinase activator
MKVLGPAMKCHRCPKQATLHITDVLPDSQYEEIHLCDDCAKKFLSAPTSSKKSGKGNETDPNMKVCNICGLKFVEFRNTGRLGCPHDYDSFKEELVPLLQSIHWDVRHVGKTPRKSPTDSSHLVELSSLRRQLQQAIDGENYETAAKLRDRIKQLEGSE